MAKIICIKKSGILKSIKLSSLTSFPVNLEDLSKHDKKLLKKTQGYSGECDFNLDDFTITILGKTSGKPGNENKKELPPPIDKAIYFDNIYAIAHNENSYVDLSITIFEDFYGRAFGGFDDLGDKDSWSEEIEEDTDDREFIDDISESPNKISIEEEEYEFSDNETTEENIVNDLNDDDNGDAYNEGFREGKKYGYLVQQFLRDLDVSLPKRRKQFYALSPQGLGEIIYSNHKDKKDTIIKWLVDTIKTSELGGVKNIYKQFLKRYKADFMNN